MTEGRPSLPMSMEESRDIPVEYLEDMKEGRLVVLVMDDTSSLGGSGSGDGV